MVKVVVCGAHMSGLPLNGQLLAMGGRLVKQTTTAPSYRFYKLPNFVPPRPGLVRVTEGGAHIEVEVWELPVSNYGAFVAAIPAPLGIGTLDLVGHDPAQGFLCEAYATIGALDISALGSWRRYMDSISAQE
jgi:allophanate hydrolase